MSTLIKTNAMKKLILSIILICSAVLTTVAQCKIKTTERPDGSIIKYLDPKPVIRKPDYEVGISVYKNISTNEMMLNVSVLFLSKTPEKLAKEVIIQTNSDYGVKLKPLISELFTMNGKNLSFGLYKINERDFSILNQYALKSLFFYLKDEFIGATITENNSILKEQLSCFEFSKINKPKVNENQEEYVLFVFIVVILIFVIIVIIVLREKSSKPENSLNNDRIRIKDKSIIKSVNEDCELDMREGGKMMVDELRIDGYYYFKTNTYNDFLKKNIEIHSLLLFNKYGFCAWVDDNEKIELNNEDFALFQEFKNEEKTHDVVLKKNKNKIELKMLEEGEPDYRLLSGELINEKLVLKHQKYYFNYALQDYELLTVMDNMIYEFKKINYEKSK